MKKKLIERKGWAVADDQGIFVAYSNWSEKEMKQIWHKKDGHQIIPCTITYSLPLKPIKKKHD